MGARRSRKGIWQVGNTKAINHFANDAATLQELESSYLDGAVFTFEMTHPTLGLSLQLPFTWNDYAVPQTDWDAMKSHFRTFASKTSKRKHWLRLNLSPMQADVFDGPTMAKVFTNFERAAAACADLEASTGHDIGLFVDIEDYGQWPVSSSSLYGWDYEYLNQSKTFAEYQLEYFNVGQEVAYRILKVHPKALVAWIFGYWVTYESSDALPINRYGLYPPFLNGLWVVAKDYVDSTWVFAGEDSYSWRVPSPSNDGWWEVGHRNNFFEEFSRSFQRYPPQNVETMWGTWLDYNSPVLGWNTTPPYTGNYFSPESLKNSLKKGLEWSDRGVWLYTQQPNFFKTRNNLPQDYLNAIRDARIESGIDTSPIVERCPHRKIIVVPVSQRTTFNTFCADLGLGPNFLSKPFKTSGTITHYGADFQASAPLAYTLRAKALALGGACSAYPDKVATPQRVKTFLSSLNLVE